MFDPVNRVKIAAFVIGACMAVMSVTFVSLLWLVCFIIAVGAAVMGGRSEALVRRGQV